MTVFVHEDREYYRSMTADFARIVFFTAFAMGHFFCPTEAFAQSTDADAAKNIFQKIYKLEQTSSKTDLFAKWFLGTSKMAALQCFESILDPDQKKIPPALIAKGANPKEVQSFFKKPIEPVGIFREYDKNQLKTICSRIATDGFRPACKGGRSMVLSPRFKHKHVYPTDYVVLQPTTSHAVSFNLECSLSTEKVDTAANSNMPLQLYVISASQIASIESFAISKWVAFGDKLILTSKAVDPNFKSPYPINLPREKNVTNIMATSLTIKLKSPAQKFQWPIAVEP